MLSVTDNRTTLLLTLFIFLITGLLPSSTEQGNMLNGKHLILATTACAPYIYTDRDSNGNISQAYGFVNELVLWLSAKYNFTFYYVEPADGFFGSFVNNSWNGMVRMMIDHEADMVTFPLSLTYARSRAIDFSIPFAIDPMVAMIPPPEQDSKAVAIIKPFKIEVWILIITSMISVAFVTWMTMNVTNKYATRYSLYSTELKFSQHVLIVFGIISNQGQYLSPKASHSTRIAVACWCLTSIVFVYLYSGCLTSFLTIPKFRPIVETLDQLADSKELQLAAIKSHFFESLLLDAKTGTYKKLGDTLRNNPANTFSPDYLELTWKLAEKAINGRYAILLEKSTVLTVIQYNVKTTRKCGVSLMKEEFFPTRQGFAVPKDHSYLKLIDQGFYAIRDVGLMKHWDNSMIKPNKCTANSPHRERKIPRLTVSDLLGTFVLWIFGIALSIVIFLLELVFHVIFRWQAM